MTRTRTQRMTGSLKAATRLHPRLERTVFSAYFLYAVECGGSPGYPVIDLAYMSQDKGFSDFITKILCPAIQLTPQIPESHLDYKTF